MKSRRLKLAALSAVLTISAGGYFVYSVFAAQALPGSQLAHAPLNTQAQVAPAFIMAVDDSGSMTFQVLFRGLDGAACWSTSDTSFFSGGELRQSGDCTYYYLLPHEGYSISRSGVSIPPIDQLGFSRSSEFNPSYFDPSPAVQYGPWLQSNGRPITNADTDSEGNAVITNTRADPRNDSAGSQYWFDFTDDRRISSSRSRFKVRSGMELPKGMEYYATGSCGDIGGSGDRNRWVPLDEAHTITGSTRSCTIGLRYFPATFYLKTETAAPDGYIPNVVEPDSNNRVLEGRSLAVNACGTGCDMYRYEIRRRNYSSAQDYQEAIQKFANWFSYYGNRNRAMIAGMTRSMASIQNMRIGYFELKSRPSEVVMQNMQVSEHREELYADMMELGAAGGTPNLHAVDHMGKQFQREDDDAPVQLACQKNAGMLFTDGFSNDGTPGAPPITELGKPFDPTPRNSLAAIATRYYLNTNNSVGGDGVSALRTGTGFPGGGVPIPRAECDASDPDKRLDCQSNLHMNFYGITLGARGEYFDPDAVPPQDPWENPPVWPSHSNDQPTTVDDILHATINTRGEFVNATTPADITDAMRRILAVVSSGESPSGSIALTGARIGSGSLTVTPAYAVENSGTDWWSTLAADTVRMNTDTGVPEFVRAWEAGERMPLPDSRNVFYGKDGTAREFNATNIELDDLCEKPSGLYEYMLLCDGSVAVDDIADSEQQALSYLLGDASLEVRNGGPFRDRTSPLGDIVNSSPVISAPTDDYGYRALAEPSNYSEYLVAKRGAAQNRRYMVYAGANDGMLHAFDGGLTAAMVGAGDAPDNAGGVEKFAYIPSTSIGHLGNLLFPYDPGVHANQIFQHRFYVDGPVVVSDAHYNDAWSTVLVGTAGAGGRSVFALDVSAASQHSGSFSTSDHLWEISDLDSDLPVDVRANIGYVLGSPVIVPVREVEGGVSWKAIFGNGYNSESGKAVLFVVDIDSELGAGQITMIEAVESGAGAPDGSNGLGNVVVVDRFRGADLDVPGQDGYADTVYAGDQKGALWKFDLRSSSAGSTPLFVTDTIDGDRNRQPIMGGLAAATGSGGGVMLYFGTGSFSFYGDPDDSTQQSLYAVNDRLAGLPTTTLDRDGLDSGRTVKFEDGVRTLDGGPSVPTPVRDGWFVDLSERERFVGNPNIAAGTVFMPTYIPEDPLTVHGGCSAGGTNWAFGLNARTGSAALAGVSSTPGGSALFSPEADPAAVELTGADGGSISAPVRDVAVLVVPRAGAPVPGPGSPGTPPDPPEGPSCWMLISTSGADPMYLPYPCGRQSWRQIQ